MTTPQPPPPSTGDEREDAAAEAGIAAAAVMVAAEVAILAAMAAAIVAVVAGSLGVQMARRRVMRAVAGALGAASARIRQVHARAAQEATAGGTRAGGAGQPGEAGQPTGGAPAQGQAAATTQPGPGRTEAPKRVTQHKGHGAAPPLPGAPDQVAQAVLNAQRDAGQAFDAAMYAALGGKGSPLPPSNPYRDAVDKAMRRLTGIGEDVRDLTGAERAKRSLSRLRASQVVLDDLASQGLTGFTDSRGRRWSLDAYAEMATRTAASRLHLSTQLSMMAQAGNDLVIVDNPSKAAPCPLCRPYEGKVLSLSGANTGQSAITDANGVVRTEAIAGTLAEAVAAGLLHPNCFPGEVLVSAPSGVRAADSRWYEGDLIVIHTASGDELPVTPNHPVLTPEGWIAAGALKVGQRVVRYGSRDERVDAEGAGLRPGDEQVPARIGDVFDALRKASPVPPVCVPSSAEQFHGEGGDADVDVVLADGFLEDDRHSDGVGDRALVVGGARQARLFAESPADQVLVGALGPANSIVGGRGEFEALCPAHAREAAAHGLAAPDLAVSLDDVPAETALPYAEVGRDGRLGLATLVSADGLADLISSQAALADNSGRLDLPHDGGRADSEDGRDLLDRFAGLVALDYIVDLGRRQIAAHVYNLQTGNGWYAANGIVVHNCRHSLIPWTEGAGAVATAGGKERGYVDHGQPISEPLPIGTPQQYTDEQKLRAHERNVRAASMRLSAAVTPQARVQGKARLAHARAGLEAHVKATGALRQPRREKAGVAR